MQLQLLRVPEARGEKAKTSTALLPNVGRELQKVT